MAAKTRHPYKVRKQSSGRTFSETYIVVGPRGRLTVHPHISRTAAQHEADTLNIGAMVKDYDEDPRPYAVRRAEAETAYRAEQADINQAAASLPAFLSAPDREIDLG